jgi:hypothetical protein
VKEIETENECEKQNYEFENSKKRNNDDSIADAITGPAGAAL